MRRALRVGARPLAAPLVVLALGLTATGLAGCTGSSATAPPAGTPSPTPSATASASPARVDRGAARALHRAIAETRKVRSYTFAATTSVAANQAVRTTIRGRLVRGNGVAYRLIVGKHRTQVVRIRRGTYVRKVPGRWSRLTHPRAIVNPTTTLLAVLRGLTPTKLTSVQGQARIEGSLAPGAAKKAGIPTDNRPASVVVTIDRGARVTRLSVNTSTTAGAQSVTVTVLSTYRGFGHARHIVAPV